MPRSSNPIIGKQAKKFLKRKRQGKKKLKRLKSTVRKPKRSAKY